jgi:hypothetical protein
MEYARENNEELDVPKMTPEELQAKAREILEDYGGVVMMPDDYTTEEKGKIRQMNQEASIEIDASIKQEEDLIPARRPKKAAN